MAVLNLINGQAQIANALGLTGFPVTMAAWIYRSAGQTETGNIAYLGTFGSHHRINITSFNYLSSQARYNNGTIDYLSYTGSTVASGTWTPVVFRVASASSRELFKGEFANKASDTSTSIGGWDSGPYPVDAFALGLSTNDFNGQMCHVAVWAEALSDTDVQSFLGGGNPLDISAANLRAYWAEDFYQDTDWYYEDKSGNGYDLLLTSATAVDTTRTPPTIDDPPSTAIPGITITNIKKPNEANTLVTEVNNARVKVWAGTNDTVAEGELLSDISITGGELSTGLSGSPAINDALTVEVMWTDGSERILLITDTTVVDLGAGT